MHSIRKRDIETDSVRDSFSGIMAKLVWNPEKQLALVEQFQIL